jgi:hypothetical protein
MIENRNPVTEADFTMLLREALGLLEETHNDEVNDREYESAEAEEADPDGKIEFDVRTFEEACLLTNNAGIVVKIGNREFQVQVVRTDSHIDEDGESDEDGE